MNRRIAAAVGGFLLAAGVHASDERTRLHEDVLDIEVSAVSDDGFDCASGDAKAYLLDAMPQHLAATLHESGLLDAEHSGRYRVALMVDAGSRLADYRVDPATDEHARVVQALLGIEQFPALPVNAACVAGNFYVFELSIDTEKADR